MIVRSNLPGTSKGVRPCAGLPFALWISLAYILGIAADVCAVGNPSSIASGSETGVTPSAPDTLVVYLTGETRGNLVPCQCPDGPWGGLDRRVGFLTERANTGPDSESGPTTWYLDSGGFLPVGAVPVRDDPEAAQRLVTLLVSALDRSGVDALALNHREREYLQMMAGEDWSLLNDRALDADPPSPHRVLDWNGTPVAVLALEASLDTELMAQAASRARADAELLFVLARAAGPSGNRIAEATGADLVLMSQGSRPPRPVRSGRTWLVGPGSKGKEVLELRIIREEQGLDVIWHEHVAMDSFVEADPEMTDRVRHLLDEFGPGWRTLVTPLE